MNDRRGENFDYPSQTRKTAIHVNQVCCCHSENEFLQDAIIISDYLSVCEQRMITKKTVRQRNDIVRRLSISPMNFSKKHDREAGRGIDKSRERRSPFEEVRKETYEEGGDKLESLHTLKGYVS